MKSAPRSGQKRLTVHLWKHEICEVRGRRRAPWSRGSYLRIACGSFAPSSTNCRPTPATHCTRFPLVISCRRRVATERRSGARHARRIRAPKTHRPSEGTEPATGTARRRLTAILVRIAGRKWCCPIARALAQCSRGKRATERSNGVSFQLRCAAAVHWSSFSRDGRPKRNALRERVCWWRLVARSCIPRRSQGYSR